MATSSNSIPTIKAASGLSNVPAGSTVKASLLVSSYSPDVTFITLTLGPGSGLFFLGASTVGTSSWTGSVADLARLNLVTGSGYYFALKTVDEAANWFDRVPIAENDKIKIGRTNAARLFGFD